MEKKSSKKVNPGPGPEFDYRKAVEADFRACLALLHIVLESPELLDQITDKVKKDIEKRLDAFKAGVPNP